MSSSMHSTGLRCHSSTSSVQSCPSLSRWSPLNMEYQTCLLGSIWEKIDLLEKASCIVKGRVGPMFNLSGRYNGYWFIGLCVSGGLVQWPAKLGNKCICVLYPLLKIVEDYGMNEQIHKWPLALFFCVPGMHSTQYGHLVQVLRQLEASFLSSHHNTSHMPMRKTISSDDDEENRNDSEGEPMPPPSKKAKTSSNKNNHSAHSATSASDICLWTASSKQAALSDVLFLPFGILELTRSYRWWAGGHEEHQGWNSVETATEGKEGCSEGTKRYSIFFLPVELLIKSLF